MYARALIEEIFGLEMDAARGVIRLHPSFPQDWPRAELSLPGFHVVYEREGETLRYTLETSRSLAREVRWLLPVGKVRVKVDERSTAVRLEPGVGCVAAVFQTPSAQRTVIEIKSAPVKWSVEASHSIAEGDPIDVSVEGCAVTGVRDRMGMLGEIGEVSRRGIKAKLRGDILRGWDGFGKLGEMNFSDRSFFLECRAGKTVFYAPVEMTILPRYELGCAPDLVAGTAGDRWKLRVLVRNNTSAAIEGVGQFVWGAGSQELKVNVGSRAEEWHVIEVTREGVAKLTPGENGVTLTLPGGAVLTGKAVCNAPFGTGQPLAAEVRTRCKAVALPREALRADTDWEKIRPFHDMYPALHAPPALEWLKERKEIEVPGLPGIAFTPAGGRQVAFVSRWIGRPALNIEVGRDARKIYLLVFAMLDHHDAFSPVARVSVLGGGGSWDRAAVTRILRNPGDLDLWCGPAAELTSKEYSHSLFSTYQGPRVDRHGLLPLLGAEASDWGEGRPPAFPQPQYWSSSLAFNSPTSVDSVIEMDLGGTRRVERVEVETLAQDVALGIIGVSLVE